MLRNQSWIWWPGDSLTPLTAGIRGYIISVWLLYWIRLFFAKPVGSLSGCLLAHVLGGDTVHPASWLKSRLRECVGKRAAGGTRSPSLSPPAKRGRLMALLPIEREAKAIRTRLSRLLHIPTCVNCGKPLSRYHNSLRCWRCNGLARRGKTFSRVLALRLANPQLRMVEIASQIGVSRERVRQILKRAGLPTKFLFDPPQCKSCGQPLPGNIRKSGLCLRCLIASRHPRVYTTFICEICGRPFERRMGEVKRAQEHGFRIRWCSKACQGKALSKSAGWGRREESQPVVAGKER